MHVPNAELAARAAEVAPDRDAEVVVYCWGPGCNGSTRAALTLTTLGYWTRVRELIGGLRVLGAGGLRDGRRAGRGAPAPRTR